MFEFFGPHPPAQSLPNLPRFWFTSNHEQPYIPDLPAKSERQTKRSHNKSDVALTARVPEQSGT
jgi:hypothetical protein